MMTQQSRATISDGTTRTVLLVEDDNSVRQWIHVQLEKSGYNLLEARDGADALLIAELHCGRIDVIVTDVVMPGLNGPELVRALLKLRPHVTVLYMSGYPGSFLKESTTLPPDIVYLEKPFPMTTLLDMVQALLNGSVKEA
jgi:two-component system cell cycle sensor histidine kinase/response regulator CckA